MTLYFCTSDQRKIDSARMDREFAQLRKTSRKKDNQIKSLLSDARHRDIVLKRRQEEVLYVYIYMYEL